MAKPWLLLWEHFSKDHIALLKNVSGYIFVCIINSRFRIHCHPAVLPLITAIPEILQEHSLYELYLVAPVSRVREYLAKYGLQNLFQVLALHS